MKDVIQNLIYSAPTLSAGDISQQGLISKMQFPSVNAVISFTPITRSNGKIGLLTELEIKDSKNLKEKLFLLKELIIKNLLTNLKEN